MLCPACGSKMNDGDLVCQTCGTMVLNGPKVREQASLSTSQLKAKEDEAKKAAAEAEKKAAEEAAAIRAAEEAAKKAAAKKAADEAAAKKAAIEAEKKAAAKRAAEEAAERKAAEEAERKAAEKWAAEAEKKAAEKRAAEEAAAREAAAEAERKAAERKAAEEAAAREAAERKAAEEAAAREAAAKKAAEEAAAKKAAEEAAAVEAAIEAAIKTAQEAAARKAAEEAAAKKAAEEAAARIAADEAAAEKAAQEAAAKKAAEETAKKTAKKAESASPVTRLSYKIIGGNFPSACITLDENQGIFTQSDVMVWMSSGIAMETNIKRGGSSFTAVYTSQSYGQEIGIASRFPGEIQVLNIGGAAIIVQKRAFLAAQPSVVLSAHVSMNLGDERAASVVFQRLSCNGMAFIAIGGSLIERVLSPGETIKADTVNIAAFEESVSFQTQIIADFQNTVFGEGLLLSTLSGPGRVWLQTLPPQV